MFGKNAVGIVLSRFLGCLHQPGQQRVRFFAQQLRVGLHKTVRRHPGVRLNKLLQRVQQGRYGFRAVIIPFVRHLQGCFWVVAQGDSQFGLQIGPGSQRPFQVCLAVDFHTALGQFSQHLAYGGRQVFNFALGYQRLRRRVQLFSKGCRYVCFPAAAQQRQMFGKNAVGIVLSRFLGCLHQPGQQRVRFFAQQFRVRLNKAVRHHPGVCLNELLEGLQERIDFSRFGLLPGCLFQLAVCFRVFLPQPFQFLLCLFRHLAQGCFRVVA